MTTEEFLILMERAKKEAYEEWKTRGDNFTLKDIDINVNRARQEEDLRYQRKLNKIREEVYQLNKEVGFYGIAGMEYKEFLEAVKGYSYEEKMKISFAMLRHIALLDNIVFDEEVKYENIRCKVLHERGCESHTSVRSDL